jgi:hypothetical protein
MGIKLHLALVPFFTSTFTSAKWSLIPINFDMLRDLPGQYQLGSNYCAPSAQARCDRIQ